MCLKFQETIASAEEGDPKRFDVGSVDLSVAVQVAGGLEGWHDDGYQRCRSGGHHADAAVNALDIEPLLGLLFGS